MNTAHIKRIQEGQEKNLAKCRDLINQWGKYKKDYEILLGKLTNLSDKVSHDMMVPLSTLALVPGKLIHTNEITVLLGDNWFAERSCKQASEIIKRRIKKCDNTIAKLREEEENTKNWMGCTEQLRNEANDFVEIVEEYDEEKEKAWREQHRRSVQQYHKTLREERQQLINAPVSSTQDIKSLPKSPTDGSSLSIPGTSSVSTNESIATGGDGDIDVMPKYNRQRRVSWQDQSKNIKLEVKKSEESSEDEEQSSILVINFQHTDIHNDTPGENQISNSSTNEMISPADIYIKYGHLLQTTPKSILKKSNAPKGPDPETQPSPAEKTERDSDKTSVPKISSSTAVIRNVVERPATEQASPPTLTRPVSRFKAQRQAAHKIK